MSKKSVMIWAWVDKEVRTLVEKIAESQGISISEYVRQLVLQDLDKRSIFTTKLKEAVKMAEGMNNQDLEGASGGL